MLFHVVSMVVGSNPTKLQCWPCSPSHPSVADHGTQLFSREGGNRFRGRVVKHQGAGQPVRPAEYGRIACYSRLKVKFFQQLAEPVEFAFVRKKKQDVFFASRDVHVSNKGMIKCSLWRSNSPGVLERRHDLFSHV